MLNASAKKIRSYARAGANFEDIRAYVESVKHPRKDVGLDRFSPICGAAEPAMSKVHGIESPFCSKLGNAQRVSIRVFEPRYPRAARRVPNTKLILLHSWIAFQGGVNFLEVLRRLNDVPDSPA